MKRIEFNSQPIYVIADLHGKINIINNIDVSDCILIVAGDIGIGFKSFESHKNDLIPLNKEMTDKNIKVLFIRGNHDDPNYFKDDKFNLSNIQFIDDYTIVSVGDKNILCVGGAISIDRKYRTNMMNYQISWKIFNSKDELSEEDAKKQIIPCYWEDEAPTYREDLLNEINDIGINIDYVITHTSPSFCFKHDKDAIGCFISNDEYLKEDLDKEREVLSNIYQYLITKNNIIKKWVYGHFHSHNNEKINGIEFIALVNADYSIDFVELNNNER